MHIERGSRTKAFVPVELLAIVAIIFLFATIALPAIARLKKTTLTARCLDNHRQLARAFQLYATDNDGKCANNFTIPDTIASFTTGRFNNWANNVMTWTASGSLEDRSVTNVDWAAKSLLHPYTDGDIAIYSCPADVYLSPVQRSRGYKHRLRSISMNAIIGASSMDPISPAGRSWGWGGQYRQWLKLRDIPNPAKTWLTIDEHPDSVNDGFFINDSSAQYWGDFPGTLHGNATSFSFIDGHVEFHPWRGRGARVRVSYGYQFTQRTDDGTRQDLKWYNDRVGFVRY
jgi:prepilin-type processing-associated H-X9-DG protein